MQRHRANNAGAVRLVPTVEIMQIFSPVDADTGAQTKAPLRPQQHTARHGIITLCKSDRLSSIAYPAKATPSPRVLIARLHRGYRVWPHLQEPTRRPAAGVRRPQCI